MIVDEMRKAIRWMAQKPGLCVDVLVEEILPIALAQPCARSDVEKMLAGVRRGADGQMGFADMQTAILRNRTCRLRRLLIQGPDGSQSARTPRPRFQSEPASILTAILQKPKVNEQEEVVATQKRLQNFAAMVADLGSQRHAASVSANVSLIRSVGRVDDRWDRYCAIRGKCRGSYASRERPFRVETPKASSTLGSFF